MKSPPPLPQAVRRFFASRTTFEPHPEALTSAKNYPASDTAPLRPVCPELRPLRPLGPVRPELRPLRPVRPELPGNAR